MIRFWNSARALTWVEVLMLTVMAGIAVWLVATGGVQLAFSALVILMSSLVIVVQGHALDAARAEAKRHAFTINTHVCPGSMRVVGSRVTRYTNRGQS